MIKSESHKIDCEMNSVCCRPLNRSEHVHTKSCVKKDGKDCKCLTRKHDVITLLLPSNDLERESYITNTISEFEKNNYFIANKCMVNDEMTLHIQWYGK